MKKGRICNYILKRYNYLFTPVEKIFEYSPLEAHSCTGGRLVSTSTQKSNSKSLILTTYFTSKVDPQKKVYIDKDNFLYIKKFYDSVLNLNLHAVIFHDNLSDAFIKKYTCKNISFIKCKIFKYSLNDERFFIYQEYLRSVTVEKVILADVNDVTFGRNPFSFIQKNIFYIGRDHYALINHSDWIKNKIKLLPETIKDRLPPLFFEMPLVNAGVLGGDITVISNFLQKITELLSFVDNDNNNNMACVNIIFFDSYWLDYHKNFLTKVKYLRTSDIKKLTVQPTLITDKFHLGKPFASHFWKFEQNNGSFIYHK